MKFKIATVAAFCSLFATAFCSTTLLFNNEFDTYVPQNLANTSGVATNGMIWGVIIDSSNNGITRRDVGSYDSFSLTAGASFALGYLGSATDDILVTSSQSTVDTSLSLEGPGYTISGGTGGIFNLSITYSGTITTGDTFYLVWFDGLLGGVLSDASFVLPADTGATLDVSSPFAGVDPIRNASNSYSGTSGTPTGLFGIQIAAVPEPSTVFLAALGSLAFLRRRRNG